MDRVFLPYAIVSVPNDLATDVCIWEPDGGLVEQLAGESFAIAVSADFFPDADPVALRFIEPKLDVDANGARGKPRAPCASPADRGRG